MKKIVTIVAVLAFIVTACAEEPGTVDTPRRIEVDATEMAFDRGSIDVTAGETVEFVVTNSGAVTHEFPRDEPSRDRRTLSGRPRRGPR